MGTRRQGRRKWRLGTSQGGSDAGFSPGVARGIKGTGSQLARSATWCTPGPQPSMPGTAARHTPAALSPVAATEMVSRLSHAPTWTVPSGPEGLAVP